MKKQTKIFKIIISLILLLGLSNMLFASESVQRILVNKQFDVKKGVVLNATHEFGKVYCKNWDRSVIAVKITVKITTANDEKVKEILDRVYTKVTGNQNKVTALCKLTPGITKLMGQHVELIMEIMMPEWVNLELDHSYGSAWVGDVTGNATIKSKYGSFTAESLTGKENKIDVSFGKATIEKLSDANIELSYGKMDVDQCGNIVLDGEYSDMSVDKMNNVKANIEGGHFSVDQINSVEGRSSFSAIEIGKLSKALIWDISYGGISVDDIQAGFSIITVNSDFGTSKLGFASGVNAKLDLSADKGGITLNNHSVNVLQNEKSMFQHHIKGFLGKNKNPDAEVTVRSNYGSIKIN